MMNQECNHKISFQVYSPHTITMGGWSRKVEYREVTIYFDENQGHSNYDKDDHEKYYHWRGAWKINDGSHFASSFQMIEDMKYCPKCGKNIESKEEKL